MTISLSKGAVVSFDVYPTLFLGTHHASLTYLGSIDSSLVSGFGTDPVEAHQRAYSSLPAGTPDDPTAYEWLLFRRLSGEVVVFGEPWIDESTLTVAMGNLIYRVDINAPDGKAPLIKEALYGVNLRDFTITIIGT